MKKNKEKFPFDYFVFYFFASLTWLFLFMIVSKTTLYRSVWTVNQVSVDPFLFVQLVFVIAAREMLQEKCCIKNCCILEWKHSYWNRLVSILSRVSILWPNRFLFYDFQATGSMDGNKPTLIPFWISLFQAFQIKFSPKIEIAPFSVMQWNLLRQMVYCRNRNFLN